MYMRGLAGVWLLGLLLGQLCVPSAPLSKYVAYLPTRLLPRLISLICLRYVHVRLLQVEPIGRGFHFFSWRFACF